MRASKTRVGSLYYSGVGNTEYIAHIFKGEFSKRRDCKVIFFERIKRDLDIGLLGKFDALGIGFPICFRRTPAIVFETIDRIDGSSKKVFTFCTKGMYSGNVSRSVLPHCQSAGFISAGG